MSNKLPENFATLSRLLQTAIAHHKAGELLKARACYLAILQLDQNHTLANHNLGILAVQIRQPASGLPYFINALNADPTRGQYWLNYIDALLQSEHLEEAKNVLALARQYGLEGIELDVLAVRLEMEVQLEELENADNQRANSELIQDASVISQNKKQTPSLQDTNDLVALFREGHLAEAVVAARKMTMLFPQHQFGWMALGGAFKQIGLSSAALSPMKRAAALSFEDVEAHYNLGVILHDLGKFDEAEIRYRHALKIKPDYAEALSNLGNILMKMGRLSEAESVCRQAISMRPDLPEAFNNLGLVLRDMARMNDAEESFRRALQINPNNAETNSNLGVTLREMGRLKEAEESFRHALQISPNNAEMHLNLGVTLLSSGKFSEGWHEYEYRWDGAAPKTMPPVTYLPQWTGQHPISGQRLLVFAEQGMGDKLQFSRYLSLAERCFSDGVSLVVDASLQALMRRSFPAVEILDAVPADQSAWHWQCPLLSMPMAFGTVSETIPNEIPYLIPDSARVTYWGSRISALGLRAAIRKIGLVWKPGMLMKNASLRALSLQQLSPLLDQPGTACFSLQKEPDPDKAEWISSGRLIDWVEELSDFDETAALAMNLDLIISVDTAVAHLAGGLGRPVWLLNRFASEWRWLRECEDSPWYPSMRIYTQKKSGDWGEVVMRIANALDSLYL